MKILGKAVNSCIALCMALLLQACHATDKEEAGIPKADTIARESGLGGTGITTACGAEVIGWQPGGRGLGGTGMVAERGLGGTGIVGVITSFGSICVNGTRVQYAADTPVKLDGAEKTADTLKLGQVVSAFTKDEGQGLQAQLIVINHALFGPVESVAPDHKTFNVMGTTVEWADTVPFAAENGTELGHDSLKPGTFVAVSGLWKQGGVLEASRVDQQSATDKAGITGLVTDIQDDYVMVSGMKVNVTRADLFSSEAKGRTALVTGQWNGSQLAANSVEVQPVTPFCVRAQRLNLEGYVNEVLDDGSFRMLGSVIVAPANETEMLDSHKVQVGDRVWVHGKVEPNRLVIPDQIRVLP